jgi:hypothetical protein
MLYIYIIYTSAFITNIHVEHDSFHLDSQYLSSLRLWVLFPPLVICTRYNCMCVSNLFDDWWFPPVLRLFFSTKCITRYYWQKMKWNIDILKIDIIYQNIVVYNTTHNNSFMSILCYYYSVLYYVIFVSTRYNCMCVSNLFDDWWFPPVLRFFFHQCISRNHPWTYNIKYLKDCLDRTHFISGRLANCTIVHIV